MSDAVLADLDADGVLTLTFNRPERRNGWDADLHTAYSEHVVAAAGDPQVRAVVVTGAGSTFCPGADLARLARLAAPGATLPRNPTEHLRTFPKPMIAAINGACAGIGLVLALFCHVRFAAEGAKFATSFARRGLPAEYGIAWLLPRMIGHENALDLMLSGRTIDAAEAQRLGLVSRVVPGADVVTAAQAYARGIAVNCAPHAVAAIIEQVHEAGHSSYEAALDRAWERVTTFIGGPDLREGFTAYVEERAPRFRPYPEPPQQPG
ncbi:enoyl-CoA hydratase-related protein [Pseudonocardia thermophila]|jgi:Enoyl-CoA hydratase/carnithine racemase|uniref:enoyl-CoA hydratase-related protein n=1 Tax=Pseudonocardia thermophila TaxID=1848 RepID=UPI00248E2DD4|nr:enoyl-CoA hydratase-related protein [Pseudonocardia thermophila]